MIAAVVLAAGAARRFGQQKLLADLDGRPLVRWTVEQLLASRVDRVLVVLGREADAVRAALAGMPVEFVANPRYSEGMGTSVAAGISALDAAVEAAVVALGDQPVPFEVVDRLVNAFGTSPLPIVAPSYAGIRGNPVIFSRALFPPLRALEGDRGARGLLEADPARILLVPFPHPPPADVDTPADLAAYRSRLAQGVQPSLGSRSDQSSQGSQ